MSDIFNNYSGGYGYEASEAMSFSIILHAYSYITYSIVGGYFLKRQKHRKSKKSTRFVKVNTNILDL